MPPVLSKSPVKIVAVGNPGAGKSSFGNCLLGKVSFRAAPSEEGGGVTRTWEEGFSEEFRYIDAPGLADADPELRLKAADQVTAALKEDIDTKILFFVRTHQGRIMAEDKVIMARVAEALGSNLQHNKYGVIVNQMAQVTYNRLSEDVDKKTRFLETLWNGIKLNDKIDMPKTDHVVFIPLDEEMNEKTNIVKPLPVHVHQFIDRCPAVKMKASEVRKISMQHFDAAVKTITQTVYKDPPRRERSRSPHRNMFCVAVERGCHNVIFTFHASESAAKSVFDTLWCSRLLIKHNGRSDWQVLKRGGMGLAHDTITQAYSDKYGRRSSLPSN